MELFDKADHSTCYNYTLFTANHFKIQTLPENNAPLLIDVDRSVIIFLMAGEVLVTCNNDRDKIHREGEMVLLPRNSCCYIRVVKESLFISCSFVQNIDLCNSFSIKHLTEHIPTNYIHHFAPLPIHKRIIEFLNFLLSCKQDGLSCVHYEEIKERELFFLLRTYYTKEQLACLFFPLIGQDMDFKEFVLANYLEIDDLADFAERANMSLDTFKRRFKEMFGESAHRWIVQRKSEFIYRDVYLSEKPFADIAMEYNFSSQAYLTTFCKQHFGLTPQELRGQPGNLDSSK